MNREIISAYFSSALRRGWERQQLLDERMHVPANPENILNCRMSWCGETKNVLRGEWVLGWLGHLRYVPGPKSRSRYVRRQFIHIHFSYVYCTTYVSWELRVGSAKGSATGGSAVQAFTALKLNIGDADTAKKLSCTGSYTCIIACDTEL
jgi:hypothetical protein